MSCEMDRMPLSVSRRKLTHRHFIDDQVKHLISRGESSMSSLALGPPREPPGAAWRPCAALAAESGQQSAREGPKVPTQPSAS